MNAQNLPTKASWQDKTISVFGILTTLFAVLAAFYLSKASRSKDAVILLTNYRNLACFSSRYFEVNLPSVIDGTRSLQDAIQPFVVTATDTGLKAIDFGKISPSDLSENFVDIISQEQRVLQLRNIGEKADKKALEEAIKSIHSDVGNIDGRLRSMGIDISKLNYCGPPH